VTSITANDTDNDQDIVLGNAGNDFKTINVLAGNNVTIKDNNNLQVGSAAVSGNLKVEVSGNLSQDPNGTVTVAGNTTLSESDPAAPGAPLVGGRVLALDSTHNTFNGRVSFIDKSVNHVLRKINIFDNSDFVVEGVRDGNGKLIDWNGTLWVHTATTLGGATHKITQTGPFIGKLNLLADSITMLNPNNSIRNDVNGNVVANIFAHTYMIWDSTTSQFFFQLRGANPDKVSPSDLNRQYEVDHAETPFGRHATDELLDAATRTEIESTAAHKPLSYISGLAERQSKLVIEKK
jgi:hypothetical protein